MDHRRADLCVVQAQSMVECGGGIFLGGSGLGVLLNTSVSHSLTRPPRGYVGKLLESGDGMEWNMLLQPSSESSKLGPNAYPNSKPFRSL